MLLCNVHVSRVIILDLNWMIACLEMFDRGRLGRLICKLVIMYLMSGIHGIAGIQEAATERNWKINNIQHFPVPEDVSKLNVT